MAREPLLNGFLSGKYAMGHQFESDEVRRHVPQETLRFRVIAGQTLLSSLRSGVCVVQAAIRYVIDEIAFSIAIAGMKIVKLVRVNCAALHCASFNAMMKV